MDKNELLCCNKPYSFLNAIAYEGHDYSLCVCDDCVREKFPKMRNDKIRTPFAKFAQYAYDVSDEDFQTFVDKRQSNNLEKYISLYGEEEGQKRWKHYCEEQVVTLESCIRKHGEEKGNKVFEEYLRKQSESNIITYNKKHGISKEDIS